MAKKIKSTTVYRIDLIGPGNTSAQKEKQIPYTTSEYDQEGQLLEEVRYREDGEVDERNVNVYDDAGRLAQAYTYLDDAAPAEHKSYERDAEGRIVRAFKHYQDGEKDTIRYNHDGQGRLVEKITIDSYDEEEARETMEYEGDKIARRVVTEYDEKTLDETYEYDEKGNLATHTKWTINEEDATYTSDFNEQGNLTRVLKYNDKGKLLSRIDYHYEADRAVKIVEEDPYGIRTTHIEYDDKGNPVKQFEENDRGELNHQILKKFNESGDVTESEILIKRHGRGIDQHYKLIYSYTYHE